MIAAPTTTPTVKWSDMQITIFKWHVVSKINRVQRWMVFYITIQYFYVFINAWAANEITTSGFLKSRRKTSCKEQPRRRIDEARHITQAASYSATCIILYRCNNATSIVLIKTLSLVWNQQLFHFCRFVHITLLQSLILNATACGNFLIWPSNSIMQQ